LKKEKKKGGGREGEWEKKLDNGKKKKKGTQFHWKKDRNPSIKTK